MDLSKKPEGATHYSEIGGTWYRIPSELGGDYDYMQRFMSDWDTGNGSPIFTDLKPIVDWTKAPDFAKYAITTGPDWRGSNEAVGKVVFISSLKYYDLGDKYWIALEQRPTDKTDDAIKHVHDTSPSSHYDKYIYRVNIKPEDAVRGYIEVKLDPYRVGNVCGVGGGALEQCLKKAMRGTDKGHSEKRVLEEIISAAKRGLEMIEEDEG